MRAIYLLLHLKAPSSEVVRSLCGSSATDEQTPCEHCQPRKLIVTTNGSFRLERLASDQARDYTTLLDLWTLVTVGQSNAAQSIIVALRA